MPWPTADIGWPLVKISASGPMPTSRYCDHAPCSISTRFSSAACGLPGTSVRMLPPSWACTLLRIASAFSGEPRACSSMTRSSIDSGKVTPAALMRLQVAGREQPRLARHRAWPPGVLARMASSVPMRSPLPSRTMAAGLSASHRSRMVGASARDVVDAVGAHRHHRRAARIGQPDAAGQRAAGAVLRQRACRRHVIGYARHAFPLLNAELKSSHWAAARLRVTTAGLC